MASVNKIDSNVTGVRFAEESSIGVLPASPTWYPLEPNSYDNFGGEITTVARNPINSGRQRQKGVVTDIDASGSLNTDLTQENLARLLQGFFFADFRRKGEDTGPLIGGAAGVTFTPVQYTASDSGGDLNFNVVGHGLVTGDGPMHFVEGSGVLPGNITEDTEYWIVRVDDDNFEVATSYANATASSPTVVAFSSAGTDDATRLLHRRDSVDGTNEYVYVNNEDGFLVNSLILISNSGVTANNGLKRVTAVDAGRLTVSEDLTDEAVMPSDGEIVVVGHQGAAGDIDVDASGSLPTLTSTSLDFTTLGLIPGEFIFIGGDTASLRFANVNGDGDEENNGFARIKSVAANVLTLDKTKETMTTEASTTETIQLFFGRVLKNESATASQVRRTYNVERELGAPDDSLPAQIQSEYLVGAIANELTLNFNTADKVTVDVGFVATDNEQRTGATGLKSGTRPAISSGDAFNTSSDFSRLKMAVLSGTDANPTPLFAFLTEFTLTINNNASPNKAVGQLGAFDMTVGQFNVDGSATAYFADVAAVSAIRNNSDVTFDFALVNGASGSKTGIAIDVPLIALGDGRLNIEQDSPVTLPLSMPAAADETFNHTLLMVFFDYLPNLADS